MQGETAQLRWGVPPQLALLLSAQRDRPGAEARLQAPESARGAEASGRGDGARLGDEAAEGATLAEVPVDDPHESELVLIHP